MPGTSTEFPFVGRERELGLLNEALDRTLAGQGQVVLLAGEAGMGKSRLAEKFSSQASARGVEVHWGRCRDHAGAPPLWPWVQVFRSLSLARGLTRERVEESGANASDLAPLLPNLSTGKGGPEVSPETDQGAQFRLFQSATWLLQRESSARPIVLILDNLHWADETSLKLLEFAALDLEDSSTLVLGTFHESEARRGTPLSSALGELSRHHGFNTIHMVPFNRDAISSLIMLEIGQQPPGGLVDAIHSHSEGNPFFAHNAIRLLQSRGDLAPELLMVATDWDLGIPAGVRELIGTRIDRLNERCVAMLRTAAVIGRQFDLDVLAVVWNEDPEAPLRELLAPAVGAGIVVEDEVSPGRFRFSHELYRQALESELGVSHRIRLHAATARAMEQVYSNRLNQYASAIAHHAKQAQALLPPEEVISALVRAGHAALEFRAYPEAIDRFDSARSIVVESGLENLAPIVNESLGRSLAWGSRPPEAFDRLMDAFDGYLAAGDTQAALGVATFPLGQYWRKGLSEMLERALEFAPEDSEQTSLLLSRLGTARAGEPRDYEGAVRAFDMAVSAAKKCGSSRAIGWAHGRRAMMEFCRPDIPAGRKFADLALGSGGDEADVDLALHIREMVVKREFEAGDLAAAEFHSGIAQELAQSARSLFRVRQANGLLRKTLTLKGEWNKALRAIEDDARASRGVNDPSVPFRTAEILYAIGDLSGGTEAYEEGLRSWDRVPPALKNLLGRLLLNDLTSIALMTGDPRFIEDQEHGHVRLDDVPLETNGYHYVNNAMVRAKYAVIMGDGDLADVALRILTTPAGFDSARSTYFSTVPGTFGGSLDRLRGQLAVTAGRYDEAITWFEKAMEFCRNGFVYDHAWSCHDLAALLTEQRQRLPRAAELIDQSERVAGQYSLKPLLGKLAVLRSQLPPPASQHPAGLSEREVEVLRLLASGKSNREIAESLFISQNTVIRHVSNIYSKIGCSNRGEAIRYAVDHDLADPTA